MSTGTNPFSGTVSLEKSLRGLGQSVTHWWGTDTFAMRVIWLVRYGTLLGSAFLLRSHHPARIDPGGLLALFSYFGTLVAFAVLGLHRPDVMLRRSLKYLQAILDIAFLSIFLLLGAGYSSPAYLFYIAPIFIMATLFARRHIWYVSLLAAAAYGLVYSLTYLPFSSAWWTHLPNFGIRSALLFMPAVSISLEWLGGLRVGPNSSGSRAFQLMLKDVPEGVYIVNAHQQLLFANPTLERRHGKYVEGQTCQKYLCSSQTCCDWCPVFPGPTGSSHPARTTLVDRRGNQYPAEISHYYLPGGELAVGFVRDITLYEHHNREDARLRSRREHEVVRLVTSLADSLESQLREPQNATAEDVFARQSIEIANRYLGPGETFVRMARLSPDGGELLEMCPATADGVSREEKQLFLDARWPEVEAFIRGRIVHVPDLDAAVLAEEYGPKPGYVQRSSGPQALCLPILLEDRPVGVVSLYGRLHQGVTQEQIRAVQTILNVYAMRLGDVVAAYQAMINEPLARHRRLEALNEIARELACFQQRDQLLDLCLEKTRRLLNAETVAIFLLERGRLVRTRALGVPNEWLPDEHYVVGHNLTGNVLRTDGGRSHYGHPIRENQVDESEVVNQYYLAEYRRQLPSGAVRHLLAVPLNGRQGTYGVLRAVNRLVGDRTLDPYGFDRDDRNFLVTLGWMLGIALELSEQHGRETRRYELARNLFHWVSSLDGRADLESVAHQALDKLAGLVRFDSASLQIRRDESLEIVAVQGLPRDLLGLHFPLNPDLHPNAAVLQDGTPLVLDDAPKRYPVFQDPRYHVNHIRSWMGVPLIYNGLVLGILTLDCVKRGFFTPDDLENVVNYVRSIAPLIWQAEWSATTESEIRFLRAYFQTLSQAAITMEMDQVFTHLSRAIQETISSDCLLIASRAQEGDTLEVHFYSRRGQVVPAWQPPPILERWLFKQIAGGESQLVEVRAVLSPLEPSKERSTTHSCISAPFTWKGIQSAGILVLWAARPGMFDRRDLELLETFAAQAGALCGNALLLQEQRLSLEAHRETLLRYASLERAALELSAVDDVDLVLDKAASIGVDLLQVEDCSIYMIRKLENGEAAVLRASTAIPRATWGDHISLIGETRRGGLTGWAILSGENLNLAGDEILDHPHWSGDYTAHLQHLPSHASHSLLILPLNSSERLSLKGVERISLGAIKFENRLDKPGQRFEDDQVKFAEALTAIVGLAVERALLRARSYRMEYGLHYYAGLLLARVTGAADVLLEKQRLPPREQMIRRLEDIRRKGTDIHRGLWNLMRDIHTDQEVIQYGVLHSLRVYAQENAPNVRLELEPGPLPRLPVAHEYHLYDIGREAIDNADRHAGGSESNPVTMRVALRSDQGRFRFSVANTGAACDPATLKGPGAVGISLMDRLAKRVGARFEIRPQDRGGVVITVSGTFI